MSLSVASRAESPTINQQDMIALVCQLSLAVQQNPSNKTKYNNVSIVKVKLFSKFATLLRRLQTAGGNPFLTCLRGLLKIIKLMRSLFKVEKKARTANELFKEIFC